MNAEIQNMIGVLIHVAKSDEFLDHEEKKVLKNIIYRYSVDSEDLKKIKSTQENLSEKLFKVKTPENKELVVKLSALIIQVMGCFRPPGDLLATRLTWRDRQDDKKNS